MKWSSNLILFIFVVLCEGLDRTRVNTNSANVNFLLNESGRDPKDPLQPQGQNQNAGGQSGRVHDLVNFYNNQGKANNPPSHPPSYSSVVSGSKNSNQDSNLNRPQNAVTPTTPHAPNRNGPSNTMTNITPQNPNNINALPDKNTNNNNNNNQGNNNNNKQMSPVAVPSAPPKVVPGKPSDNNNKQMSPVTVPSAPPKVVPGKPSDKPTFSEILSGGQRGGSGPQTNGNKQAVGPSTQKPSTISTGGSGGLRPPSPGLNPNKPITLPSSIVNNRQGNEPGSGRGPTDSELQALSEELLRKDVNNAAKLITVNYQEKTSSSSKEDKAPKPLLVIPQSVYNIPTIQKFIPLLDNYERDVLVNEYVTPQERNEENAFMDAIMQTQVIRHLMTFLKEKDYVTPDPRQQRDFLKQLWFNLYSRGKGKISSSGFEHVFVSELRNDEVLGLHNWLYFAKEEAANRVNYLGYLKYSEIADKGAVMKLHFTQNGADKPVDSMFVGTSPELEVALYSLCFITRHDQDCPLKLGGKHVSIKTHTFRYRSKNMIGSAFPQLD